MILLREVNTETEKLLIRISNSSKSTQVRNRAKCILLSYQGFSSEQLITLFGISIRTLHNWLTKWEKRGFIGLYNQKRRGRKALLNQSQCSPSKRMGKSGTQKPQQGGSKNS